MSESYIFAPVHAGEWLSYDAQHVGIGDFILGVSARPVNTDALPSRFSYEPLPDLDAAASRLAGRIGEKIAVARTSGQCGQALENIRRIRRLHLPLTDQPLVIQALDDAERDARARIADLERLAALPPTPAGDHTSRAIEELRRRVAELEDRLGAAA